MSEEKKIFGDGLDAEDKKENDKDGVGDVEIENTSEPKISAENDEKSDTVFFGVTETDVGGGDENGEDEPSDEEAPKKAKKPKSISIKAFVIATIAVIVATLMLTYSICSAVFQSMYAKAYVDANQNSVVNGNIWNANANELDVIAQIIDNLEYHDVDTDKMMTAAIKAYVEATGDKYAAYYTEEELEELNAENVGKMTGIGVKIINDTLEYNGEEHLGLYTINVMRDSPAEEIGMRIGDFVYKIYTNETDFKLVTDIGYDEALSLLLGEAGTKAKYVALRKSGDTYEEVTFEPTRREITTTSVNYYVSETLEVDGKKVGILEIIEFNYTTPTQFTKGIDSMKAEGCEKFIIDVRNNPGGYGDSLRAILSYFLNENDVYVRIKDKKGEITQDVIAPTSEFTGDKAGCNISKEDIGKYKDLDIVVVCNEFSISAAELFVATVKDYNLATVVGTQTYGKGTMQSTYDLEAFGIYFGIPNLKGAIKITSGAYMSAKSDNYDGVGIAPDVVKEFELSEEELEEYSIYDLPDNLDDQYVEAIKHFKK